MTGPSVQVEPSTKSIAISGTAQLTASTLPANRPVTWTTSASAYATVSSTGLVTGVGSGSATITATATIDGQTYTDTCAVTVS